MISFNLANSIQFNFIKNSSFQILFFVDQKTKIFFNPITLPDQPDQTRQKLWFHECRLWDLSLNDAKNNIIFLENLNSYRKSWAVKMTPYCTVTFQVVSYCKILIKKMCYHSLHNSVCSFNISVFCTIQLKSSQEC